MPFEEITITAVIINKEKKENEIKYIKQEKDLDTTAQSYNTVVKDISKNDNELSGREDTTTTKYINYLNDDEEEIAHTKEEDGTDDSKSTSHVNEDSSTCLSQSNLSNKKQQQRRNQTRKTTKIPNTPPKRDKKPYTGAKRGRKGKAENKTQTNDKNDKLNDDKAYMEAKSCEEKEIEIKHNFTHIDNTLNKCMHTDKNKSPNNTHTNNICNITEEESKIGNECMHTQLKNKGMDEGLINKLSSENEDLEYENLNIKDLTIELRDEVLSLKKLEIEFEKRKKEKENKIKILNNLIILEKDKIKENNLLKKQQNIGEKNKEISG